MIRPGRQCAIGLQYITRRGKRYVTTVSGLPFAFGGDANDNARIAHESAALRA